MRRIFHRVVEEIGDGGAQFVCISGDDGTEPVVHGRFEAQSLGLQIVADASYLHAFPYQLSEIERLPLAPVLVPGFPSLEHLLDGSQQAVSVVQHEAVKLVALSVLHLAAFQGLQIEADGSNGSF